MDSRQGTSAAGTVFARSAALAGPAAFILLAIITQSLMSNAPSATESSQMIFSYLALHQGQLQASAVLAGLAASAVLVWIAALFRTFISVEGRTTGAALAAFGGGVLTVASTVTLALIGGTTATRLNDLGPAGAGVFWTMIELSRGAILAGLLVVIGATALVCLRTQRFRGFAVPSAMVALLSGIGACSIGYTTPWVQSIAGLAIFIDGLWILIVGNYLAVWNRPYTASGPRTPDQTSEPSSGPHDYESSIPMVRGRAAGVRFVGLAAELSEDARGLGNDLADLGDLLSSYVKKLDELISRIRYQNATVGKGEVRPGSSQIPG